MLQNGFMCGEEEFHFRIVGEEHIGVVEDTRKAVRIMDVIRLGSW